ncbi:hypothetical protein C8R44DRAFT_917653 [Mycena epipterygia]|nr:hypothetical protein C8R44DRAFT_917653 [Mycena epipterygia]
MQTKRAQTRLQSEFLDGLSGGAITRPEMSRSERVQLEVALTRRTWRDDSIRIVENRESRPNSLKMRGKGAGWDKHLQSVSPACPLPPNNHHHLEHPLPVGALIVYIERHESCIVLDPSQWTIGNGRLTPAITSTSGNPQCCSAPWHMTRGIILLKRARWDRSNYSGRLARKADLTDMFAQKCRRLEIVEVFGLPQRRMREISPVRMDRYDMVQQSPILDSRFSARSMEKKSQEQPATRTRVGMHVGDKDATTSKMFLFYWKR